MKEESEIEYLQKDFKKDFSLNGKVIFQRFSEDWNEAVDLGQKLIHCEDACSCFHLGLNGYAVYAKTTVGG